MSLPSKNLNKKKRSGFHFQPLARQGHKSRYHEVAKNFKPLSLEEIEYANASAAEAKPSVVPTALPGEAFKFKPEIRETAGSVGEPAQAKPGKAKLLEPEEKFGAKVGRRLALFWRQLLGRDSSGKGAFLKVELLQEDLMAVRSALPEIFKLLGIIFGVAVVSGLIWGYDTYLARQHVGVNLERQKRLDFLNKTTADMRQKQAVIEESSGVIKTIYNLLAKRVYWPKVLSKLEELTLRDVYYTQLRIDRSLAVSIVARAARIDDALQQINVWRGAEECISNVEVAQFDLREETVKIQPGAELALEVSEATQEGEILGESTEIGESPGPTVVAEEEAVEIEAKSLEVATSFIEFPVRLRLNPACFSQ